MEADRTLDRVKVQEQGESPEAPADCIYIEAVKLTPTL